MKRILSHPVLSESPSVITFVNGSEEEIEQLQNSAPVAPKEEEKKESKGFFASLASLNFNDVTSKLSGAVTAASTVPVEVMPWFDTQTGYVVSLQQCAPSSPLPLPYLLLRQLMAMQSRANAHSSKQAEMVDTLVRVSLFLLLPFPPPLLNLPSASSARPPLSSAPARPPRTRSSPRSGTASPTFSARCPPSPRRSSPPRPTCSSTLSRTTFALSLLLAYDPLLPRWLHIPTLSPFSFSPSVLLPEAVHSLLLTRCRKSSITARP